VNSKSSVYKKGEDFHLVPFLTIKLLFLLLLGMIPGDAVHGRLLWFATNRHLFLQFNNCFELEQVTPPITATLRCILLLEVLLPRAVTADCVLNRDDAGNIFSTSILAPISPVSLSTKKPEIKNSISNLHSLLLLLLLLLNLNYPLHCPLVITPLILSEPNSDS
jgi:hypothetical protein